MELSQNLLWFRNLFTEKNGLNIKYHPNDS